MRVQFLAEELLNENAPKVFHDGPWKEAADCVLAELLP